MENNCYYFQAYTQLNDKLIKWKQIQVANQEFNFFCCMPW